MKTIKVLGIIAISMIIGFTFTACGDSGDPTNPSVNPHLIQLATPSNLQINDTTKMLTWDAVANVSSYALQIDNNESPSYIGKETHHSLANLGLYLHTYTLKVKARGDGKTYGDSEWSDAISYTLQPSQLSTPRNLKINNAVLSWDPVNNAGAYAVDIDGMEYSTTKYSYALVDLTEMKTYSLKVKATSNKPAYADSDWSLSIDDYTVSFEIDPLSGLKFTLMEDGTAFMVSRGTASAAEIIIPPVYNDLPVTLIAYEGFKNFTAMTNVTIPDSVASIGEYAFSGCTGLTGINIPDNVTGIEHYAFTGCTGLTDLTIPHTVESIGFGAFQSCYGLRSMALSADILDGITFTFIFGSANPDYDYSVVPPSLKTVIITGGDSIGHNTFRNCRNLTNVIIGDSVTSFGQTTFYGCTGLTSITIPFVGRTLNGTSDTNFGYLFGSYSSEASNSLVPSSLKTVIITGGNSISDSAFSGCRSLTSVTIPNSVKSIGSAAFSGCISLTSTTIPDSVTSVGSGAFYNCASLTSITIPFIGSGTANAWFGYIFGASSYNNQNSSIPSTLRTVIIKGSANIENQAFYRCSGLANVTIPAGVERIGDSAFSGCSGLTSITIPKSVASIGDDAFYNCSGNLESINVENDNPVCRSEENCLIRIADNTLILGCKNSVIPGSVTSIDHNAFYGCIGLTDIIIPSNVTSIGSKAFEGCTSLTSITIPFVGETLNGTANTDFGYIFLSNFSVPSSLKTVIITGGNSIGENAFDRCSDLISITIPDSVTSIGGRAFQRCSGLTTIVVGNGNTVYRSEGNCIIRVADDVLIVGCKNSVIPNSVKRIESYAFDWCFNLTDILTDIIIPNSVTSIGQSAFFNCTGLRSITIPFVGDASAEPTQTSIGYIFGTSNSSIPSSLRTVVITDCDNIGRDAFSGCNRLTSITIPNSVTSIGYYAFYGCTGLTGITIPNSVIIIGDYAFSGCTGLTGITIPTSVTSIGNNAFFGCDRLTSITIPDSVTSIGNNAFNGCTGLTGVTIGNGVIGIGQAAFLGCGLLTSITIPNSVTSIGYYAFSGCTSLTSITIPFVGSTLNGTSNTSFGHIFDSNFSVPSSLKTVIITGGDRIFNYAFYGCDRLTSVTMPEGVMSIGEGAFLDCDFLRSITIPGSVASIGNKAFDGCGNLLSVTFGTGSNITSFGNNAFPQGDLFSSGIGGNLLREVYDGAGTYERTLSANSWKKV